MTFKRVPRPWPCRASDERRRACSNDIIEGEWFTRVIPTYPTSANPLRTTHWPRPYLTRFRYVSTIWRIITAYRMHPLTPSMILASCSSARVVRRLPGRFRRTREQYGLFLWIQIYLRHSDYFGSISTLFYSFIGTLSLCAGCKLTHYYATLSLRCCATHFIPSVCLSVRPSVQFFDFVVFLRVFNFYVLFVLCVCVCVFLLCCFSFFNEFFIAALCE